MGTLKWTVMLAMAALLGAQQQSNRPRVVLKGGVQENHRRMEGGGGSSMKPENGGCPEATNGWVLVYSAEGDCRYWHAWPARGERLPPITKDGRGGGGRCQFCPAPYPDLPEDSPPNRLPVYVPGGYDPCQNPRPPAGCAERRQGPGQQPPGSRPDVPDQNPPQSFPAQTPQPGDYFRERAERTEGFKKGLQDCIQELLATPGAILQFGYNAFGAAASFGEGDLDGAAYQLGMGQWPQAIQQELNPNRIRITPFEQGRIMARRLCLYGVVPQFAKGAKGVPKAAKGRGATPFQPFTGNDVRTRLGSVGNRPNGATIAELENQWVDMGNGPMRLGKQLGGGDFATVYQVAEGAGKGGQVIKFAREGGEEALRGQVEGFRNLKSYAPQVPTPELRQYHAGSGQVPAHVMVDDVNKAFRVHYAPPGMYNAAEKHAIRELHWDLGRADLLAPDLHEMNVFLMKDAAGNLRAGVLDTDMINKSAMRLSRESFPQRALFQKKLEHVEAMAQIRGLTVPNAGTPAGGWMDTLYKLHYTNAGVRP
ncbi:MAG: hypothetical protein HY820_11295 [Acidobacteria bacterium]|nr:hypothetical protein [Acidobacteriota bacterium]